MRDSKKKVQVLRIGVTGKPNLDWDGARRASQGNDVRLCIFPYLNVSLYRYEQIFMKD